MNPRTLFWVPKPIKNISQNWQNSWAIGVFENKPLNNVKKNIYLHTKAQNQTHIKQDSLTNQNLILSNGKNLANNEYRKAWAELLTNPLPTTFTFISEIRILQSLVLTSSNEIKHVNYWCHLIFENIIRPYDNTDWRRNRWRGHWTDSTARSR